MWRPSVYHLSMQSPSLARLSGGRRAHHQLPLSPPGVGYGQMIGTASVVSYYVALMALTVFYFVASFSSVLPWTVCDPSWADMTRCVDPTTNLSALNHTHGDDNLIGSTEMYFM